MQVTQLFWLTYRGQLAHMQWALAKLNCEIGRHIAAATRFCIFMCTYICVKSIFRVE